MQQILTAQAAEGMVLAKDVETREGRVLCGKGTVLTGVLIERLTRMEIFNVTVEGHPIHEDGEKSLAEMIQDVEARFSKVEDVKPLMYLKKIVLERLIASREE